MPALTLSQCDAEFSTGIASAKKARRVMVTMPWLPAMLRAISAIRGRMQQCAQCQKLMMEYGELEMPPVFANED